MSGLYSNELVFFVNGIKIVETHFSQPEMTLLSYLRDRLQLTGSKLGCGEGGCGACTVMVSKYDAQTRQVEHFSVNACLAPVATMDGCHIVTIEGIGDAKRGYHPTQTRVADFHGSQCGFCTPGIVMALYTQLRRKPKSTRHELEEGMDGNLCRCTGYRPLNDAVKSFAVDGAEPASASSSDARNAPAPKAVVVDLSKYAAPKHGLHQMYKDARAKLASSVKTVVSDTLMKTSIFEPYNPTGDEKDAVTQFPAFLKTYPTRALKLTSALCQWFRPVTMAQLLSIKHETPSATIIVGNTEIGIYERFGNAPFPVRVSTSNIPDLRVIQLGSGGITFGASVTITEMKKAFDDLISDPNTPAWHKRTCEAYSSQIRWFSSTQIRNVCTIGGNIMNASPISDLCPLLQAGHAMFKLNSKMHGVRECSSRAFFLDYKRADVKPTEVLESVFIPFCAENQFLQSYKQSRRRDDDIAIVTAGLFLELDLNTHVVSDVGFSFGGKWKTVVMAPSAEQHTVGKRWTRELISELFGKFHEDMCLAPDTPGGMEEFRMSLAASFLLKFYIYVMAAVDAGAVSARELSCAEPYTRDISWGKQVYQIPKDGKQSVGQGKKHLSARIQASGEAKYTDDIADPEGCLHAALIGSPHPHCRITGIDTRAALAMEGVESFYDHRDVPGSNVLGEIVHDEWCFVPSIAQHVGEPLGIIVARTKELAIAASKAVKVSFEPMDSVILTINDAIAAQSFHKDLDGDDIHVIQSGNLESELGAADVVLTGEAFCGGQEHFYLECHNCLVIPREEEDWLVISSTQNPTVTQHEVAHVLGLDANKVNCQVKRLGGGFGGKETRSANLATYAAVAAFHEGKPVRLCLERDVDMSITGQRHPFKGEYKVAFDRSGKLRALDIDLYNNAGFSLDLSYAVCDRAMFHIDNVYTWPALRVTGRTCKTNLQSNTAFRGFGGPQGMIITEMIIERIAAHLNMHVNTVREMNFYKEGDTTHYNQKLLHYHVPATWEQMKARAETQKKEAEVAAFNRQHRYKKRGIGYVPTKFGISFTALFLNQGGALVHVYKDGSVLVSHGGTEMGQGLHTKMAQVAADAFGIPLSLVHVNETATDKVANTSPTAASFSSDINGYAVLDACCKIKDRMTQYMTDGKTGAAVKWRDAVNACYFSRVHLSASGFCKIEGIGYDMKKNKGDAFRYFTTGAAAAVVEIDTLTGDFHTVSADCVMDLGASLNPVIDIGQIEGAFVQGMGWCTMEEYVYGDNQHKWVRPGHLHTKGPGAYKIPAFNDTPLDFNVYLLKDAPNPTSLHSSKAVGEPPFFLSSCVFFAIKNAITAARAENDVQGFFQLQAPATSERIRMACCDEITERFVPDSASGDSFFQTKGSF